jgi:hypothetical protein
MVKLTHATIFTKYSTMLPDRTQNLLLKEHYESIENPLMKVRSTNPNDVPLIFSFIQKKAAFDRNIGAFSGVLQVSEEKVRKTLFGTIPGVAELMYDIAIEKKVGEEQ